MYGKLSIPNYYIDGIFLMDFLKIKIYENIYSSSKDKHTTTNKIKLKTVLCITYI